MKFKLLYSFFISNFIILLNDKSFSQDVLLNIKFENIQSNQVITFKGKDALITVEAKNAEEAKQLTKDLRLSKNPADIAAEAFLIKPHEVPADDKVVFDIKTSDFSGANEVKWIFVHKGVKTGELTIRRQQTSSNPNSTAIRYTPEIPTLKILGNFDSGAQVNNAAFDAAKEGYTSMKGGDTNHIVYSFCSNGLFYNSKGKSDKKGKSKFRLKAGTPLSIELNPLPNPLRYDVSISSKYNSFNTEADELLTRFLLNAGDNMASAQSGGADDKKLDEASRKRKELVLGYLYRINADLTEFLEYYLYTADCVDAIKFINEKNAIDKNIKAELGKEPSLRYPGNLIDWMKIEFDDYDSTILKPFIHTYQRFKALHISTFKYQIPYLKNEDELSVNLKIRPSTKSNATLKLDSMDLDLPIFGGFKVDVSPGLFYTFFSSNVYSLYDDSTIVKSSQNNDSVTSRFKSIQKEKLSMHNIGISSLLHFYPRIGKSFNVSANIGVGLTLEDKPQVRYLTGFSLLIGRVNRIAITGGWAFGKVDEISDRYLDGKSFKKVNLIETKLETKKDLQSADFLQSLITFPL